MNKLKKILLGFFLCLQFSVTSVYAVEKNIPILTEKVETVEQEEKLGFFENFYYRLFEKDTKDLFDYSLLGVFIVGLLIVMVFQNTHYTMVKSSKEPNLLLTETPIVEEVVEPEEIVVEEVEPSEILPSELLEEEPPKEKESPKGKKNRNR